jgi:cytochrome c biogenesis protein CcmG, thiol:disulfide interchange protein DsbE
MRRVLLLLAAVALVAVVVIGLTQAGGERGEAAPARKFSLADAQRRLAGAPAPLAALHRQANELLPGGKGAFAARLRRLKGHPVVINKWASWCGPCRFEFPWFQSLAEKRGGQIAFLGVNSNDSDGSAEQFLSELPLPYPSYTDPDLKIAEELGGPPQAFPTTTFYDRTGKPVFTHPGVYQDESDLVADVERYAGG